MKSIQRDDILKNFRYFNFEISILNLKQIHLLNKLTSNKVLWNAIIFFNVMTQYFSNIKQKLSTVNSKPQDMRMNYEIKYNKGRKRYILFSDFEKCLQTRKHSIFI